MAEADPYPYNAKEVVLGFSRRDRRVIIEAAKLMKGTRPRNQHARQAASPEAHVESLVPYGREPKRHRRILGAAGSYAKAMGWWAPKPRKGSRK